MRASYGLTVPLLLLTAAFTSALVPQAAAQDAPTYYTISGRVTSDTGAPLAGVSVSGYTYSETDARMDGSISRNADVVTNDDGQFALKLPAGKGWINVYYEKWRQGDSREIALEGDQTIDFTLKTPPPKDAIIEGRVVDANGNPVANAQVTLQYRCCYAMPATATPEPASDPATTEGSSGSEGNATATTSKVAPSRAIMPPYYDDYASTTTDADGRFRFEAYAGPRQISAWAKGFAQTTVDVEAVAGQTVDVDVTLEKVPASDAVITGRVVDSLTGAPLARAQVSIRSLEWGRYDYAETDASGSFRLTTVPGWTEISVNYYPYYYDEPAILAEGVAVDSKPMIVAPKGPEYFSSIQLVKLASGENDFDVKLDPKPKPTIALIGYVVDPDTKKAVPDARVSVWNMEGGDWGEAITDATGSFKIMVRAGHYSANAYKEGYLGGTQTFVVDNDATQRHDLILPKGTAKWAPCYEDSEGGCGPILYAAEARSASGGVAYAEDGGSGTSDAKAVGMTTGAPAPAMGTTQATGLADTDESASASAGGDRSKSASFEGSGGGLPEYDPDDASAVPAAQEQAPMSEVPAAGALLGILAMALVAVLVARKRNL